MLKHISEYLREFMESRPLTTPMKREATRTEEEGVRGAREFISGRNPEQVGPQLVAWDSKRLLDLHGVLGLDRPVAVLKADDRGRGKAKFLAQVLGAQAIVLAVAPEWMRSHGYLKYPNASQVSILKVSHMETPCVYHSPMPKKTPPEWAGRFEAMRQDKGVTLDDLATAMDRTVPAVRHWLNGHRQITVQQLLDLCAAAAVDPVAVLFGKRYISVDRWQEIQGAAKTLLEAQPTPYKPKKGKVKAR